MKIAVEYDNESSLPHDVHFFAGADAGAPSLAATKVATGPDVQEISFTTPSKPGTYFFRCDRHPEIMTGPLVRQVSARAGHHAGVADTS
jgi:plastocyanin